jgi:hypothetical protein
MDDGAVGKMDCFATLAMTMRDSFLLFFEPCAVS